MFEVFDQVIDSGYPSMVVTFCVACAASLASVALFVLCVRRRHLALRFAVLLTATGVLLPTLAWAFGVTAERTDLVALYDSTRLVDLMVELSSCQFARAGAIAAPCLLFFGLTLFGVALLNVRSLSESAR